jgi:hypothetical protein
VRELIDDPIKMDAFYLEMRLVYDPNTGNHAEDFNLMVNNLIEKKPVPFPPVDPPTPTPVYPVPVPHPTIKDRNGN